MKINELPNEDKKSAEALVNFRLFIQFILGIGNDGI